MLIEDYNLLFHKSIMEKTTEKISNPSAQKQSQVNKVSFCGIMKDSTSELIKKLEFETPSLFQEYSDLHARYLHSIQDVFGACSLAEKQYFEKLEVDPRVLDLLDDYVKSCVSVIESQFDFNANLLRSYIQFRLSFMDSWDKFAHHWVNMYARNFSKFFSKNQTVI